MTNKRKAGLGRGLESLIPTDSGPKDDLGFMELDIESIKPNPDQPRARFDKESLDELADSIAEVGILQPIVVTVDDKGNHILIAGERRWRASKQAGLSTIPAVVREGVGESTLVEALVENVQRRDLTPLEEAHAYQQLLENTGMKQEEVAKRVGKSRSAVSNTLRLLQLPAAIQSLVDSQKLSAGHARALVGMDDEKYSVYLAEKAVAEGWSVRQMEDAVRFRRDIEGDGGADSSVRQVRPVEIIELEQRLSSQLGSKVKITYKNEKGKVEIKFASLEDLERIYRQLA